MSQDPEQRLKTAPIYSSLNRPILFMGGERELMMLLILFSVMFVVVMLNIYLTILGIIMYIFGVFYLRRIADITKGGDPQMSKIFVQYTKLKKFYYPSTRDKGMR